MFVPENRTIFAFHCCRQKQFCSDWCYTFDQSSSYYAQFPIWKGCKKMKQSKMFLYIDTNNTWNRTKLTILSVVLPLHETFSSSTLHIEVWLGVGCRMSILSNSAILHLLWDFTKPRDWIQPWSSLFYKCLSFKLPKKFGFFQRMF